MRINKDEAFGIVTVPDTLEMLYYDKHWTEGIYIDLNGRVKKFKSIYSNLLSSPIPGFLGIKKSYSIKDIEWRYKA